MNYKVYAPNVYLFAFCLKQGSNSSANAGGKENDWLWQKGDEIIYKTLRHKLNLIRLLDKNKQQNNSVSSLKATRSNDDDVAIPVEGKVSLDNQQIGIQGFVYPLQIYDSYGLWLNLRRPEKESNFWLNLLCAKNQTEQKTEAVDIQLLRQLNPDNCLMLKEGVNFLGQTLLITAWLTPEHEEQDQQHLRKLADESLKAFFPKDYTLPPFSRSSQLFGSPIFEYGLFSHSQLSSYRHVLVWLFRNGEADQNFNACYQDLLELFFYRVKVVKAFQESRYAFTEINDFYDKEIVKKIDEMTHLDEQEQTLNVTELENLKRQAKFLPQTASATELENLKRQAKSLPQTALKYTKKLHALEDWQNTIKINADNYNQKIEHIKSRLPNTDLSFLETFVQKNSVSFQEQIKADLRYVNHGSGLLDKAIASIRVRVEIDQVELDRQLQNTIQVVGVGIGTAGVAATLVPYLIPQNNSPTPVSIPFTSAKIDPFAFSLILSISIGAIAAALTMGWIELWQRYRDQP